MSNNYLAKQIQTIRASIQAKYDQQRFEDFRFARQLMADISFIALEEALGTDADKLEKFASSLSEIHDQFADIWNADSDDVEYSLDILDRRLKPICGSHFQPAKERYEGITFRGLGVTKNGCTQD